MEGRRKPEETNKETKDEKPGIFSFIWRCMEFSRKHELPDARAQANNGKACTSASPSHTTNGRNTSRSPINGTNTTLSPVNGANNSRPLTNIEPEFNLASQLRQFSFNELKHATRNFKAETVLGSGGFGRVYKGWVNELGSNSVRPGMGLAVAIKTLNQEGRQGHKEWLAEINFLGKLHHPNLVTLVGFCIEGDNRLLVYEFMARGSLDKHLFRRGYPMSWSRRIKIALDAARGLAYLHEEADNPVIYRDFKASNILLDVEFNAKLSDFGLAKDGPDGDRTHVSTRVMGTYGYAAPEYVMTGHLTSKSDVYSFGVVLLEMLSGRKSVDRQRPAGKQKLLEWAMPYLRDKHLYLSVIDPSLQNSFPIQGARKAVHLATRCISQDPKSRPLMSEVVQTLKPISEMKEYPRSAPVLPAQSSRSQPKSQSNPSSPRVESGRPRPLHRSSS